MDPRTLKSPDKFINILVNLPECGTGYQIVKIILKNRKVLYQHNFFNSEILMHEENENTSIQDIQKIVLDTIK